MAISLPTPEDDDDTPNQAVELITTEATKVALQDFFSGEAVQILISVARSYDAKPTEKLSAIKALYDIAYGGKTYSPLKLVEDEEKSLALLIAEALQNGRIPKPRPEPDLDAQ